MWKWLWHMNVTIILIWVLLWSHKKNDNNLSSPSSSCTCTLGLWDHFWFLHPHEGRSPSLVPGVLWTSVFIPRWGWQLAGRITQSTQGVTIDNTCLFSSCWDSNNILIIGWTKCLVWVLNCENASQRRWNNCVLTPENCSLDWDVHTLWFMEH